ncbi:hypothetical protein BpHYR1_011500 [Brachionus plicatilis]|uniref:Uncharacterized protein n=1 Tax=Brachionus plicatilis TaxID=10195 RepID=A0A3M7S4Z5_BRAPC|nr:hypothetical protein BpHYR1_011500 [Brachionus plicatilis]
MQHDAGTEHTTKKNEIIENQRDKPLSFNHSLNSFHILHKGVFCEKNKLITSCIYSVTMYKYFPVYLIHFSVYLEKPADQFHDQQFR